jgi:hypothetical protein
MEMIHVLRYTSSFIALFLIGGFYLLCVTSFFPFSLHYFFVAILVGFYLPDVQV